MCQCVEASSSCLSISPTRAAICTPRLSSPPPATPPAPGPRFLTHCSGLSLLVFRLPHLAPPGPRVLTHCSALFLLALSPTPRLARPSGLDSLLWPLVAPRLPHLAPLVPRDLITALASLSRSFLLPHRAPPGPRVLTHCSGLSLLVFRLSLVAFHFPHRAPLTPLTFSLSSCLIALASLSAPSTSHISSCIQALHSLFWPLSPSFRLPIQFVTHCAGLSVLASLASPSASQLLLRLSSCLSALASQLLPPHCCPSLSAPSSSHISLHIPAIDYLLHIPAIDSNHVPLRYDLFALASSLRSVCIAISLSPLPRVLFSLASLACPFFHLRPSPPLFPLLLSVRSALSSLAFFRFFPPRSTCH